MQVDKRIRYLSDSRYTVKPAHRPPKTAKIIIFASTGMLSVDIIGIEPIKAISDKPNQVHFFFLLIVW